MGLLNLNNAIDVTTCTGSCPYCFCQADSGYIIGLNGTSSFIWDGDVSLATLNVYKLGVYDISGGPTVTVTASKGNASAGTYYCGARYVRSDGTPGNLGTLTEVTATANARFNWTTPGEVDTTEHISTVELYRSLVGNSTTLYRVAVLSPGGTAGADEVQSVTLGNVTGGTWTLTYGTSTATLNWNDSASTVQTVLQALSTIGSTNATVTGSAGGPYTVTFVEDLKRTNLAEMTASAAGLSAAVPTYTVTETTAGVSAVAVNEVQSITFGVTTGIAGTWTITFNGYTTTALQYDATANQVDTALGALTSVGGAGNITVGGGPTTAYTITFDGGALAATDVAQCTVSSSLYRSVAAQVFTVQDGAAEVASVSENVSISAVGATSGYFEIGVTGTTARSTINWYYSAYDVYSSIILAYSQVQLETGEQSFPIYPPTGGPISVSAAVVEINRSGYSGGPSDLYVVSDSTSNGSATVTINTQGVIGSPAVNEQQCIWWATTPSSGTWTITFGGYTTSTLQWNANSAQVTSALTALTSIGSGNVNAVVGSGDAHGLSCTRYVDLFFQGSLAATPLAAVTVNEYEFGAAVTITPATVTAGRAASVGVNEVQTITATTAPTGGTWTLTYTDPGVNEVQRVTLTDVSGGTYTLTLGASTTAAITWNAASSAVQSALQLISTIGSGNVTVTGSAGGPYTATFGNDLKATPLAQMTSDSSGLTGPGATITLTETTQGVAEVIRVDEVQTLTVTGASSGTFTIRANNYGTSVAVAYDATAGTVETAIEGTGFGYQCTCGGGPLNTTPVTITIDGDMAKWGHTWYIENSSVDPGTVEIALTTSGVAPAAAVDEVQDIDFSGTITAGTWTINFDSAPTAGVLNWNCSNTEVQTALEGLTTLDSGDVAVTGSTTAGFTVTFGGTKVGTDVPMIVADDTWLTVTPLATVSTITNGAAGTAETTGSLNWNATAAEVKTALAALSDLDPADLNTTGGPLPTTPIVVTFQGAVQYTDIALMTANCGSLTLSASVTVATVTNGYADYGTPSYLDTYSDAQLLLLTALPVLNTDGTLNARRFDAPPSGMKVVVAHGGRYLYMAAGSSADEDERLAVYFSYVNEPESVSSSQNKITLERPSDGDDEIVGAVPGDTLYILGRHHVWMFALGYDPRYEASSRIIADRGACNHRCAKWQDGALYCMDDFGAWRLKGGVVEDISEPVRNLFRDSVNWNARGVDDDWFFVSTDHAEGLVKFWVIYHEDGNITKPTRAIVFNAKLDQWADTDSYPGGFCGTAQTVVAGKTRPIFGGASGKIFTTSDTACDFVGIGATATFAGTTVTVSGFPALTGTVGGKVYCYETNATNPVAILTLTSTASGSLTVSENVTTRFGAGYDSGRVLVEVSVTGTVTSAASTTLVDTSAAFGTGTAGLVGVPVHIVSGTGRGQTRYISSTAGTTLNLTAAWTTTPVAGDRYVVGAIPWELKTTSLELPLVDPKATLPNKAMDRRSVEYVFEPTTTDCYLLIGVYYDRDTVATLICDEHVDQGLTLDADTRTLTQNMKKTVSPTGDATGYMQFAIPGIANQRVLSHRYLAIYLSGASATEEITIYSLDVEGTG